MTFRGFVRNGRIDLEPGAALPNGTEVRVEPVRRKVLAKPPGGRRRAGKGRSSAAVDPADRLYELAVATGIRDLAAEHDHYIYGTPKRSGRTAPKRSTRKGSRPSGVKRRGGRSRG